MTERMVFWKYFREMTCLVKLSEYIGMEILFPKAECDLKNIAAFLYGSSLTDPESPGGLDKTGCQWNFWLIKRTHGKKSSFCYTNGFQFLAGLILLNRFRFNLI